MGTFRKLGATLAVGLVLAGTAVMTRAGSTTAASIWSSASYVQTTGDYFSTSPYPDPYYSNESDTVNAIGCGASRTCSIVGTMSIRVHDQLNGTWVTGPWTSLSQLSNGTLSAAKQPTTWNTERWPGQVYEGLRDSNGMFIKCFTATSCIAMWNEGEAPHVSTMTNGQWGTPQTIRGLTCTPLFEAPRGCSWGTTFSAPGGTANMEPNPADIAGGGRVTAFDCSSAGNCIASGFFLIRNRDFDAVYQGLFVAVQTNGVWATPVEVSTPHGSGAQVKSASCASAGNCAISGVYYSTPDGDAFRPFVVTVANGVPSPASTVPGMTGLSAASSIDCAAAGQCTVAGFQRLGNGSSSIFTSNLSNGTWSNAALLSGASTTLNFSWEWYEYPTALQTRLECPSVGNCTIAGSIRNASNVEKSYISTQSNGTWGAVTEMPGIASLGNNTAASVTSLACPSTTACVASGYVKTATTVNGGAYQPYVATKVGGTWGNATSVLGLDPTTNSALEGTSSYVSCSAAGECAVAGTVLRREGSATKTRVFVTTFSDPTPPTTTTVAVASTTAPVTTTLPPAPIAGILNPGLSRARVGTQIVDVFKTVAKNGDTVLSVGSQTFTVPDTSLNTDKTILLSGKGALPGSTVVFQLFSTPQVLGTAIVAADGTYSAQVSIPANTPDGNHSLQFVSTAANGSPVVLQVGVSVAKQKQMPMTGGSIGNVRIAGLLLLLGFVLLTFRSRRTVRG